MTIYPCGTTQSGQESWQDERIRLLGRIAELELLSPERDRTKDGIKTIAAKAFEEGYAKGYAIGQRTEKERNVGKNYDDLDHKIMTIIEQYKLDAYNAGYAARDKLCLANCGDGGKPVDRERV